MRTLSLSLEKAKLLLRKNQYPPSIYKPAINKTLSTIYSQHQFVADKEVEEEPEKNWCLYNIVENFEKTVLYKSNECALQNCHNDRLKSPVENAMKNLFTL